jgi:peptidoglycan/LPS O-acetylase OafA/YrhL
MQTTLRRDDSPLAIGARAVFLALIATVCVASLAPVSWFPRVLDSHHLEHFAAFYLIALSMAAARYRVDVKRVLLDAVILASLIAIVSAFIPAHQLAAGPNWIAEIGGVLAALCPIMVAEFRGSFRRHSPPAPPE